MKDTPAGIQDRFLNMILKKSSEERARMAFSQFDFAKGIVISSIKSGNPGISKKRLRSELFLRFYGLDFDPETRNKIVRHLKNA
ncbi:MAG: hypothetical protein A3D28_00430 [Omnitrophica bacterium RIFCSPHIGHO2_02_FULL_63_14]|nr:MAG: hypothetical protein A3D28_00430 [Omnitrophica bacterium RIFCSPHIGHO2_02_FULL_63_14]